MARLRTIVSGLTGRSAVGLLASRRARSGAHPAGCAPWSANGVSSTRPSSVELLEGAARPCRSGCRPAIGRDDVAGQLPAALLRHLEARPSSILRRSTRAGSR